MTTPAEALATTLVDELARAGVRHACISPGSRSAPFAIALAEDDRIQAHVLLDERSAGFLAVGIAKSTERPVAVLTTSGTAAANLLPAVIEAAYSRTPLVIMTADRPPELRATGAPQTIDQLKLFGDAVRWFAEVGTPDTGAQASAYWRSIGARACIVATGSPPGPVHLNLPLREPLLSPWRGNGPATDAGRAGGRPWTSSPDALLVAPPRVIETLSERIAATERGVIVAGPGTPDPGAVVELARAARWPVLAEPASNARMGENAISTYDALLRHEGFARGHRPDLVLRVGASGISKALDSWLDATLPQVLVDAHGSWLDPTRSVAELVRSDPSHLCRALTSALGSRGASPWLQSWLSSERAACAAIDEVLDVGDEPSEPRTARDLPALLHPGATLIAGASMPVRDLDWFMRPREGLRVIANRGANGIDGLVSTALGVATSRGPVAALVGDLSLLHDQNGFLHARHSDLDAVFVVLNNGGGGVFSFLPQAGRKEHFEALFATPQHVGFDELAGLYGLAYARVEAGADLGPLVGAALRAGGVHLVEVRTDRTANVELHDRLWSAVARALDDVG